MKIELEHVLPADIERRSFAIISQELGPRTYGGPYEEGILKRVIHTSADFDYSENLKFSPGAVEKAMEAIRAGADIVTDTQMARAGTTKLPWPGLAARCTVSWRTRMWPQRRRPGESPGRLSAWKRRRT